MLRIATLGLALLVPNLAAAQIAATIAPPPGGPDANTAPAPAPTAMPAMPAMTPAMPAATHAPAAQPKPAAPAPIATPTPAPGMHMSFHSDAPSTAGYKDAMDKMMTGMEAPFTGDPDRDFVVQMIPHHQGAVDMAAVELKEGHDPKLKALAKSILAGQQKEIELMKAWLAHHPEKHLGTPAMQAR